MPTRLLTACVVATLALAAPAGAAAKLVVSATVSGPGRDSLAIEFQDASPASLALYAPPGVEATLTHAPGTELGSGAASLRSGGADSEAAGTLLAADPTASACGAGHDAVWRLQGPAASVELAVDRIAPGAPESPFASYRIAPCGDTLVRSLQLRLQRLFRYPSTPGAYVWRAIATPVDGAGAPVAASAVEHRSTQLVPARVTLRASFDRATGTVRLSGRVSAGSRPLAGVRVALAAGASASSLVASGRTTTGARGRFELRRPVARTTTFRASVETSARDDPAGCPDPVAPAGGCVSATLAPLSATSDPVRVRVPALRALRLGARGAEVALLRRELARLRYLPPGGGAVFDERTWHAVVALQGWHGLPRTGVVERRTWKALRRARVPAPWARMRRGVLIDTARQVLLLVDGGRTVRAIHVSTGAGGRTPRGRFSVYRKEILSWSVPFSVWMPYASYFVGGFAMHAYPSVPAYPASHGCVRIPPVEAPGVYRFARYGTPVIIR